MRYGNYVRERMRNLQKRAEATGSPCIFEKSAGRALKDYQIYGNSVERPQEGENLVNISRCTIKNGTIAEITGLESGDYCFRFKTYNNSTNVTARIYVYDLNGAGTYLAASTLATSTGSEGVAACAFNYVKETFPRVFLACSLSDTNTVEADEFMLTLGLYTSSNLPEYKAYETIPSPDNPVEIKSVGDLITDETSEYYGKYDIPVKVLGKNLLSTYGFSAASIPTPSATRISTNSTYGTIISTTEPSDSLTITAPYTDSSNLSSAYNGYFCIGLNEDIEIGKKYRFSFDMDIISNPGNSTTIPIKPNGGSNVLGTSIPVKNGRTSGVFTYIKSTGFPNYDKRRFIELTCRGVSFTMSNLMITPADIEDITYELYQEPVIEHIYLDEPLRKIGDCADYIDYKNRKVVRNTKKVTFDGTENWIKETVSGKEYSNFYVATNPIAKASSNVLSNRFIGSASTSTSTENNAFISYSTKLNITNSSSAVADWEALLSIWNANGEPLTVYYILETPTEESVVPPSLHTMSGVNTIIVNTAVSPSNTKVKYVKR